MKIILSLLLCSLAACGQHDMINRSDSIDYKQNVSFDIVQSYAKCIKDYKVKNDTSVVIYSSINNDTTFILLSNELPFGNINDIETYSVENDTIHVYIMKGVENSMFGVKVKIFPNYLEKNKNSYTIPRHPINWEFYLKDSILVDYYPKESINKYIKLKPI